MADSFQNEIPKARVNITLDVETNEGRKKKELPLKLLVMADFSQGKTLGSVADRAKINVNQENLDKVLQDLSPVLSYTVTNAIKNDGSLLKINLLINSIKSFQPEYIIQQVPELRNLLAMRNLLKDLKANILDNASFRCELEKIMQDKSALQALKKQLTPLIRSE